MRNPFALLALAALVCPAAFADQLPNFLNSNAIERNLPTPNLPVDTYRPPAADLQVPQAKPTKSLQMKTRVQVRTVQIEGGTRYPIDELAELYRPLIGQEASLEQLIAATRQITKRYQDDGYLISYAYLPNQQFKDGLVRVVLVEGHVADVRIEGEIGPVRSYLERLADKLRAETPLTRRTFERYTALMSRIPGVKVRAELPPPGTRDGAARLAVVAERTGWSSNLALSDDDRAFGQALITGTANAHTALGEQVSLALLVPPGEDHERYVRLDYGQYLSDEGTRLKLSASTYRSEPADDLRLANGLQLQRERRSDRVSLGIEHPFIAASDQWLSGSVRLYGVDDSTRYHGVNLPFELETRTDIRVLALETDWRQATSERFRVVSAGLYRGLDSLGAMTDSNLFDLDFTRLSLYGLQSDKYGGNWQGVMSAALYWSEDNLPDAEQAVFGGQNFARGYPSDQANGDKGWGASYELNYSFSPDYQWLRLVQPYAVVDTARTWFNEQPIKASHLASGAFGVRFGDARYYNLSLEVAKPLADVAADNRERSPRLTVGFSYQL